MLLNIIKKLFCRTSLGGVTGIGEVTRGTIEEKIWGELGALPRSRHHDDREAIGDQVERQFASNCIEPEAGERAAAPPASGA
jgi:hypothetical protein